MRYLAIDVGGSRTGLALGDDETGLAGPVGMIEVPAGKDGAGALLAAIRSAVTQHLGDSDPGELVVGLPLNMDGTEGPAAKAARALAARLAEVTGRVVHLHDERLSSAQADWSMARSGLTRGQKKQRRDALAAATILADFLASRRHPEADRGSRDEDRHEADRGTRDVKRSERE